MVAAFVLNPMISTSTRRGMHTTFMFETNIGGDLVLMQRVATYNHF